MIREIAASVIAVGSLAVLSYLAISTPAGADVDPELLVPIAAMGSGALGYLVAVLK